jgi:dGTPase
LIGEQLRGAGGLLSFRRMSPKPGITYAPYATLPEQSRGRRVAEPESETRTPFQRDRDRIVHATAFRRLKHKTQVFVAHEGDHYRTRLTHSLEVAQIARSISRQLGLNEDLAEALALAHDLGHTPFGHAGEEALNACMAPFGGFDHNAQTLRIVTRLERKYAAFDGLNLTWETLEGVVKHNGPLVGANAPRQKPLPEPIREYNAQHDLALDTFPGPEAQVAALADDIAYNTHDIDDGLRAKLFAVADVKRIPVVAEAFREVEMAYAGLEERRLIHEAVRRLIDRMVRDLLVETRARITAAQPETVTEIRALGQPIAAFSPAMGEHHRALKSFLFTHMYRHDKVTRMTSHAATVVRALFARYRAEPALLPEPWREAAAGSEAKQARVIADYIAGMTDNYALDEHKRLFKAASSS